MDTGNVVLKERRLENTYLNEKQVFTLETLKN